MKVKPFAEKSQRIHLLYDGRVQGVGFRLTFDSIAGGLGVTGYVRNLSDGTVEAVCEGLQDKLDVLMDKVTARMGQHILSCKVDPESATGEFVDFRILF